MQSESVATPWGRWAKTMPLICFPTGRRFCFELCPEFVISYPDYGLKIPRRLSFLFRNLPGESAGGGMQRNYFSTRADTSFQAVKIISGKWQPAHTHNPDGMRKVKLGREQVC